MPQIQQFLYELFSERVRDCELQLWSSDLYAMPKLKLYSRYKESRREELYLSLPIPRRLRADLARYRTTSHSLEIELENIIALRVQTDFVNYAEDIMLLQRKMKFMLCLTVKPIMILETFI